MKVEDKMRLTKRFILKSLNNIILSNPIRYERYYINEKLRIQKKDNCYEKEMLDEENALIQKNSITEEEFLELKSMAYSEIIRDSYLYLKDNNISIKKYYNDYEGLNRIEVKFSSKEEMNSYIKESWMGEEITSSPLAFDKYLSRLNRKQFLEELKKYL